ncbi:unnamed protein product [Ixodes pacificus]
MINFLYAFSLCACIISLSGPNNDMIGYRCWGYRKYRNDLLKLSNQFVIKQKWGLT